MERPNLYTSLIMIGSLKISLYQLVRYVIIRDRRFIERGDMGNIARRGEDSMETKEGYQGTWIGGQAPFTDNYRMHEFTFPHEDGHTVSITITANFKSLGEANNWYKKNRESLIEKHGKHHPPG